MEGSSSFSLWDIVGQTRIEQARVRFQVALTFQMTLAPIDTILACAERGGVVRGDRGGSA